MDTTEHSDFPALGRHMHALAAELFPLTRSLLVSE